MTALGTAQVIQGNALALPLEDASVDLICTSPPYFGLRSYQDAGQHYDGQIGSEATPTEFLDALIAATAEMVRVLKPSGSIFVNLGDKYAGGQPHNDWHGSRPERQPTVLDRVKAKVERDQPHAYRWAGIPTKSLMGMPWRYAIRCIDQLGLILRAEIIWSKPNGLPESVTDRVRRSHEQWFHFTKEPRYFSAVDEIREEHTFPTGNGRGYLRKSEGDPSGHDRQHNTRGTVRDNNPLGKLPGSVWSIPSQPLTVPPELGVDHFAAYPMEWPRRLIQGWTPSGICTACGEGRRPVTHVDKIPTQANWNGRDYRRTAQPDQGGKQPSRMGMRDEATITGYMCGCATPTAPTRPAVVLDPFGGTGTTALVAKALGRTGITIDLSADYCRLAEWRVNDPGQLAQALQIEKPEYVPGDQLSLFGDMA